MMVIRLRDEGESLLGGVVVIFPATDLTGEIARKEGSSYQTRRKKDEFFSKIPAITDSNSIINAYCTDNDPRTPYLSPLQIWRIYLNY
ncbi:MAG: hypothetical protein ACFFC6_16490 [Promethearchaeota archaeon]